jgi:hypothetical protein
VWWARQAADEDVRLTNRQPERPSHTHATYPHIERFLIPAYESVYFYAHVIAESAKKLRAVLLCALRGIGCEEEPALSPALIVVKVVVIQISKNARLVPPPFAHAVEV